MNRKYKIILTILVLVLGTTSIVLCTFRYFNEIKDDMKCYSNISLLKAVVRESLHSYYCAHDCYPTRLEFLRDDILARIYTPQTIPKEPKELELLKDFTYISDGNSYKVTCKIQFHSKLETYIEHVAQDRMVFTELYIDGQLRSRCEYSNGNSYPFSGLAKEYRDGKLVSITEYKGGEVISEKTVSDN